MEQVLLHICCGICASWPVEKLQQEGFSVTGYFYNPNIHPEEEYARRLAVCGEVLRCFKIPLIPSAYDPGSWLSEVSGLEGEPEGGRRCEACFRMRIRETWKKARASGFGHIATTLSVSPHKNSAVINRIGSEECSGGFLAYDFKKEDGFKKANAFSKEHRLYRQHYCGCTFSGRPAKV